MKILWYSTSSNNTDTVIASLGGLGQHAISLLRYDDKWNRACAEAVAQSPDVRSQLQAGQFHLPRERVGMDAEMLRAVREIAPDVAIYTSAWEGDFVPAIETLGEINAAVPLIHLCYDASDPPWWPQLQEFERRGVFALTVNIDGGEVWPGGRRWAEALSGPADTRLKNGLTRLTPLDASAFAGVEIPFTERPYAVGYAGNAGGWIRNALVQRMQRECRGFVHKPRDDHAQSYRHYCDFLRHCRVSISIPFSGSNAAKQVKGRVVETAYAGACLLDWRNDATRAWFTPRYEFEEYGSIEECIGMAEWLAAHPQRCAETAAALSFRVRNEHSAAQFWAAVLGACGR